MRVRAPAAADWAAVESIYRAGIAGGDATFETEPPTWSAFDAGRHAHLRLVAVTGDAGAVVGWAAASPTSPRRAYGGVAEHSVYVAAHARGRGVGALLLDRLVRLTEACGVWTLQSGIFPENAASLALHARAGFRVVGRRERVGRLDGRWRDVVLVERRSPVVGGAGPLVRLAVDAADRAAVRALLETIGLPTQGLDDVWRLWVADADGTAGDVVGAVALERHPGGPADGFLLRSLVVAAPARGRGLGRRLVDAALHVAGAQAGEPPAVGLLTTDAADWFSRNGFRATTWADLPAGLAASSQLTGACPTSAQAMVLAPAP